MIWDLHCHLSGVAGDTPAQRTAELLRYADRLGIERICLFMGMNWSYDPSPEDMCRQNDEVLAAIDSAPGRVFGFVYLNPNHLEASLKELDRCVKNGPMVGVKLWVAKRCDAPEVDSIVQRAIELEALVFQHTYYKINGNLPGESTPEDLAKLALRHPEAVLICGHTGADWELGIRAIRDCLNVSVDLSGSDPMSGMTEMAVRELGAERVIFGSDAGGRSYASQLGKVFGADLSERARKLILRGNLVKLLTPILKRKGVKL